MLLIDNIDEVAYFCKVLNEINQYFKNIYELEAWFHIEKENIAYNHKQFPSLVKNSFHNYKYNKKNKEIVENVISYFDSTIFMIIPKEFFDFYKNFKKNINCINIENNKYIEIKTIGSTLRFDYNEKMLKKKDLEIGDLIFHFDCRQELSKEMLDYNNDPFNLILNFDKDEVYIENNWDKIKNIEDSFLVVNMNKKFIPNLKYSFKKLKRGLVPNNLSKISINVYDTSKDYIIIELEDNDLNFDSFLYYGVIDYSI